MIVEGFYIYDVYFLLYSKLMVEIVCFKQISL